VINQIKGTCPTYMYSSEFITGLVTLPLRRSHPLVVDSRSTVNHHSNRGKKRGFSRSRNSHFLSCPEIPEMTIPGLSKSEYHHGSGLVSSHYRQQRGRGVCCGRSTTGGEHSRPGQSRVERMRDGAQTEREGGKKHRYHH
jgi:hypothetical protein